jgi:hypothetical protein
MCPLSHMQACVAAQWMIAFATCRHMPAERLGSASLNRPLSWFASKPLPSNGHNLELSQANMPRIGPPPRGAIGAENVSDLQLVPGLQPRVLLEPPS